MLRGGELTVRGIGAPLKGLRGPPGPAAREGVTHGRRELESTEASRAVGDSPPEDEGRVVGRERNR